jgi:hypothetical protein
MHCHQQGNGLPQQRNPPKGDKRAQPDPIASAAFFKHFEFDTRHHGPLTATSWAIGKPCAMVHQCDEI